jgi:amino acid permease
MILVSNQRVYLMALFELVTTSIGSSVIVIPSAVAQLGFVPSMIIFTMVAMVLYSSAYMLYSVLEKKSAVAEGAVKTYVKLADSLLGRKGSHLMYWGMASCLMVALAVYLSGGGIFLSGLAFVDQRLGILLFFGISALIVVAKGEKLGEKALVIGLVLLISLFALIVCLLAHVDVRNIAPVSFSFGNLSMVLGVATYSLIYHPLVINAWKELESIGKSKSLPKILMLATIVTMCTYFLLSFAVVGSLGPSVGEVGFNGIQKYIGSAFFAVRGVILFCALLAPYVSVTTMMVAQNSEYLSYLKLKATKKASWIVTLFVPLGMALLGESVCEMAAFAGGIGGIVFVGILPLLLWLRASQNIPMSKLLGSLLWERLQSYKKNFFVKFSLFFYILIICLTAIAVFSRLSFYWVTISMDQLIIACSLIAVALSFLSFIVLLKMLAIMRRLQVSRNSPADEFTKE